MTRKDCCVPRVIIRDTNILRVEKNHSKGKSIGNELNVGKAWHVFKLRDDTENGCVGAAGKLGPEKFHSCPQSPSFHLVLWSDVT